MRRVAALIILRRAIKVIRRWAASLRVSVPNNWRELAGQQFGLVFSGRGLWPVSESGGLHARRKLWRVSRRKAVICNRPRKEFLNSLAQGNGNLRQRSG